MKWLRACLSGAALVALPAVFLQGLANAEIVPGPINWNGFWQSDIALAFLAVEQTEAGVNVDVQDGGLELARSAFSSEPLASNALFILATEARANGDTDAMQQLLALGASIDKRNRNIGALQLEQAALAGNLPRTFDILDRLSVVHPELTEDLVQPLTLAMEDDDSVDILRDVMEEEPTWGEAFWLRVPTTQNAVLNMAELRRLTSHGTSEVSDTRLLAGLVRQEQYEQALALWSDIAGAGDTDTAYLPTMDFAPIGWQAVDSGERSFNARGEGEFEAYVENQTFGELARQLVRLSPGTYGFSATISPLSDAEDFEVDLQCADGGSPGFEPQALDDTVSWTVDSSCSVYWLVLSATAWERRRPLRADVSDLDFARAQ